MKPELTGRALTEYVAQRAREVIQGVFRDRRVSEQKLAARLGLAESRVFAWWNTAHAPAYLIAHPETPDTEALAMVAGLLGLRSGPARPAITAESAALIVARFASETIAQITTALADGRLDARERAALRPAVASLRDRCDKWLREHGGDVATSPGGVS